jgi:hypothetical protein
VTLDHAARDSVGPPPARLARSSRAVSVRPLLDLARRGAGRLGTRASTAAFGDAARRGGHVLRHARFARPPSADVFNLDLHVAVVADVGVQLRRRHVSLVDWTLSGHSWVVGRERDPVAVVNERTWPSFGPRSARRFRRVYGSYLRSFRGFVATYPPCFALLYEGLERPTLAIAATRYEWPFTHDGRRWDWLDERLRAGVEAGWLTLAANNRADADYLAHYAGLEAVHIPGGCSYTGLTYTGRRSATVICTGNRLAETIVRTLRAEGIPLRSGLGARYSQAELYDHRALVFIPYNVSIMSLFEHYTACAPIYVPARAFLKELAAQYPDDVLSSLSFSQVTGLPAARRCDGLDLNDLGDEAVVDWYLDRADFYDRDWMPHVRQFESWQHLDHLLATDDPHAISAEMAAERPARLQRIADLWDGLPWLAALA